MKIKDFPNFSVKPNKIEDNPPSQKKISFLSLKPVRKMHYFIPTSLYQTESKALWSIERQLPNLHSVRKKTKTKTLIIVRILPYS